MMAGDHMVGISQNRIRFPDHAMLKDMNGNQISIEKTDTDIINIYATVYTGQIFQAILIYIVPAHGGLSADGQERYPNFGSALGYPRSDACL